MNFLKYISRTLIFGLLIGIVVSCNSGDDDEDIYTSYSNTMVRTFSLASDVSILPNLSYRYFTIDLVNGLIFNPDSLPYGTDISALVPKITFASASKVEITVQDPDGGALLKTVDYLENDKDSIDFNNDVKMKVVAANGVTTQNYRIKVLVHKVQADSLVWTGVGERTLPTTLPAPHSQKTIAFRDKIYCFTSESSSYNVAVTDAPSREWSISSFIPALDTMSVSSIVVSADTIYALGGRPDDNGNMQLLSSVDGKSWTAGQVRFSSLIGVWENVLVGILSTGTSYNHATYADGVYVEGDVVSAYFPISGHSATVSYNDENYGASFIYFFGGRCADGRLSAGLWAYDGESWANISDVGYDGGAGAEITPREGALFFAYFQDDYDPERDLYVRKPYYYILGGQDASGVRNDLYYTNTLGGYWEKAAQGTPLYISAIGFEPRMSASACVVEEPAVSLLSAAPGWRLLDTSFLLRTTRANDSLVPYIYVFGGYNRDGELIKDVNRGVITRFTF